MACRFNSIYLYLYDVVFFQLLCRLAKDSSFGICHCSKALLPSIGAAWGLTSEEALAVGEVCERNHLCVLDEL